METLRFARADERVESAQPGPLEIDPTPLLGCWINTNTATPGIAKVIVTSGNDGLSIRVFSASGPTPRDWGNADVEALYSTGVHSLAAMAFAATYDFDTVHVQLEANLSLGLLVIATCNTFTDRSRRSNFFGREFFYRSESTAN
jgi:hypothetical protein